MGTGVVVLRRWQIDGDAMLERDQLVHSQVTRVIRNASRLSQCHGDNNIQITSLELSPKIANGALSVYLRPYVAVQRMHHLSHRQSPACGSYSELIVLHAI